MLQSKLSQRRLSTSASERTRPGLRRQFPNIQCTKLDHTVRVRGDLRRVFKYVSNLEYMTDWYPATMEVVKRGAKSGPVQKGTRYYVKRGAAGLTFPMNYEVLQYEPGKTLVVTGVSDHHTQVDNFFFMQDRNDANFTVVRYMADIRLRGVGGYLQPIVSKVVNKWPEVALQGLQKVLNSPQSPLYSLPHDSKERQYSQRATYTNGRSSTATTSGTAEASYTAASESPPRQKGWSVWNAVEGLAGDLQGQLSGVGSSISDIFGRAREPEATTSGTQQAGRSRRSSSAGGYGTTSSGSSYESPSGTQWRRQYDPDLNTIPDILGYYRELGLGTGGQAVTIEQVKVAYRQAAMRVHPDKLMGADELTKQLAAEKFLKVAEAYEVLKDPLKKSLYDEGRWYDLASPSE